MRLPIILTALLLAGCSEWGTSLLRPVDVWWACPHRAEMCSPEAAALTLWQMDNTFRAVHRDALRLEGLIPAEVHLRLMARLKVAAEARSRVRTASPSWGPALAEYVNATVRAERLTARYFGKLGR